MAKDLTFRMTGGSYTTESAVAEMRRGRRQEHAGTSSPAMPSDGDAIDTAAAVIGILAGVSAGLFVLYHMLLIGGVLAYGVIAVLVSSLFPL